MNLNISEWKEYRLGDLFEIKKGKRLTSEDQTEGNTPYIGAIDSNNGVSNHIGQSPTHDGNTISLSYNGSVGYAFYQPVPFWATDDVNVLYFADKSISFNRDIALFICTILKQEQYRYCYGRKWVLDSMNETRIKLPTKDDRPDFAFMEQYIKSLHYKSITTKISNKHVVELDTSSWKNFYLHKIFNATMGNGIDAISTTHENPVFNYVGRSANNNGVTDIIDEIAGEKVFPAGAITLPLGGSIGACFLQTKPFYTAQNVAVLLEKVPLSIAAKMFIVSIIKTECLIKFQPFGRELNAHFRKDFILRLPVKHNRGKIEIDSRNIFSDEGYIPDWQWMENYIKELPYSDRI